MLQRMFDGSLTPSAPHGDDIIEGPDGPVARRDGFRAATGAVYSTEEERDEAEAEAVAELLNDIEASICDYTQNEDYAEPFVCCAFEGYLDDCLQRWYEADPAFEGLPAEVKAALLAEVDIYTWAVELEYSHSEYAPYRGPGCEIFSAEVGEVEEQIDIACYPLLERLHEVGCLNQALAGYGGDLYLSERQERDENGYYRGTGDYVHHGCLMGYTNPGGRWHVIVPPEDMEEALVAAVIAYCRKVDRGV